MAPDSTKKKKKGKKDLSELKRELELDEHRVPIDELYRRYCSDPKKVPFTPVVFLTYSLATYFHPVDNDFRA